MTVLARLGIANPGALVAAMQRRGLVQLPATGTRGSLESWRQRHPDKARLARRKAERLLRLKHHRSILVLAYAAACIGFGIIMGRMAAFYF